MLSFSKKIAFLWLGILCSYKVTKIVSPRWLRVYFLQLPHLFWKTLTFYFANNIYIYVHNKDTYIEINRWYRYRSRYVSTRFGFGYHCCHYLQIWCYDWKVNIFKSKVYLLLRVSSFQSMLRYKLIFVSNINKCYNLYKYNSFKMKKYFLSVKFTNSFLMRS